MRVDDGTLFPDPGDWCWGPNSDNPKRIVLGVPGVGTARLEVVKGDDPGTTGVWGWNGDLNAPTLTPSIDSYGGSENGHWHGFLRNGKLESV